MSDLWLAVDGGQTATIAVVATSGGQVRGVGRGGPLRHELDPDAEGLARRAIAGAVGEALRSFSDEDAVVLGCLALTGSQAFAEAAVRRLVPAAELVVLENDAVAALAAGTLGGGGVGLIAGTGSVAVATGRRGDFIQRGGWGWMMGDEGGAFWIGLEALRAAARHRDGTGPQTQLTTALPAMLGKADLGQVRDHVTGGRIDRTAIAGLAPGVVKLAASGDAAAASIIDESAFRLSELVTATIAAAAFLEPDERVIVGGGGVLQQGGRVAKRVAELLADRASSFAFVVPHVPPVIGALYLGLRHRGVTIDDRIRTQVERDVRALGWLRKTPA